MLTGPAAFVNLGNYLIEAVVSRLQANGVTVPARRGVVPAPLVADDCACGTLAVAVGRIYGSDTPLLDPAGGGTATATGGTIPYPADEIPSFLNAELQVAVLRCADMTGTPTPQTLAAEAAQVHADAYWTQVAVTCELARLQGLDEIVDYTLGDQPFLGPAGGCQGGQFNVVAAINNWCPC